MPRGAARRRLGAVIANPILRGFNPDPSIVRVGNDYYIATSTFEWYPGVQIYHSRDLAHLCRKISYIQQSSAAHYILPHK